jgi:hypothetical protein
MPEGAREPATLRVHSAGENLHTRYSNEMKEKRTKPAELNTAPLPALKIGLSADTAMVHQAQGLALLALIPLAFHNTHSRDDGIHRLATRAKDCVPGS